MKFDNNSTTDMIKVGDYLRWSKGGKWQVEEVIKIIGTRSCEVKVIGGMSIGVTMQVRIDVEGLELANYMKSALWRVLNA